MFRNHQPLDPRSSLQILINNVEKQVRALHTQSPEHERKLDESYSFTPLSIKINQRDKKRDATGEHDEKKTENIDAQMQAEIQKTWEGRFKITWEAICSLNLEEIKNYKSDINQGIIPKNLKKYYSTKFQAQRSKNPDVYEPMFIAYFLTNILLMEAKSFHVTVKNIQETYPGHPGFKKLASYVSALIAAIGTWIASLQVPAVAAIHASTAIATAALPLLAVGSTVALAGLAGYHLFNYFAKSPSEKITELNKQLQLEVLDFHYAIHKMF